MAVKTAGNDSKYLQLYGESFVSVPAVITRDNNFLSLCNKTTGDGVFINKSRNLWLPEGEQYC
jgi:hypothetical protein